MPNQRQRPPLDFGRRKELCAEPYPVTGIDRVEKCDDRDRFGVALIGAVLLGK